jgi:phosphoglucomutase
MRIWFIILALLLPLITLADVVTDWNEIAGASATTAKQLPFEASRTMALLHTAIFDSVNSIEPHYRPYKTKIDAPAGSSIEAAAAAAAHATLVALFPDQKSSMDSAYATSLSKIADGNSKNNGIAVGEKVAAGILAFRQSDGSDALNVYQPKTTPGSYVPTMLPVGSNWGNVKP